MSVRIKVCGITSYEDAALAVDCGADALGFNFHPPSPRFIDPAAAREIVRRLPPLLPSVGVFVNVNDPEEVARLALAAGVHVIQLHGDESAEYCGKLHHWPLIKAVRLDANWHPAMLEVFPVGALLFDTKAESLFGGTGKTFDWGLLQSIDRQTRIILAGGLNPANVAEAVRLVRPYAVDVCSGVESAPGRKDPKMLKAFVAEVNHAIDII